MPEPLPEAIATGLVAMGLLSPGQLVQGEALAGGVSSDIWHLRQTRLAQAEGGRRLARASGAQYL